MLPLHIVVKKAEGYYAEVSDCCRKAILKVRTRRGFDGSAPEKILLVKNALANLIFSEPEMYSLEVGPNGAVNFLGSYGRAA